MCSEVKRKDKRQIKALKYAIEHDVCERDKEIHIDAIKSLEKALEKFEK